MKSFFLTGLEYGHAMNTKLSEELLQNKQEDGIKLLSHVIHAQNIWLNRLRNSNFQSPPLWDPMEADELKARIDEDYQNWKNYLNSLSDADMDREINYQNLKGDKFTNKISDVLFHVINHGTHHRGQVSRILREGGSVPPVTDYIFYIREKQ